MASVTSTQAEHHLDPPRIGRVPEAQRRTALALLLTGRANPDDISVDQFLTFAGHQHIALDHLWAGFSDDKPVAVCLIFPSAGRTGMCFISRVKGPSATDLIVQVVQTAVRAQDPARMALLQTLLDPEQRLEKRALSQAGFMELATLCYMQREADLHAEPMNLGQADITVLHYSAETHDHFARAILASYEDTLDCPGLVGLRRIGDIIAGHKAAGLFDPALWYAFYHGDQPVGVMLLADLPQRHSVELVYLGLSPAFRGRGLAKRILHHGLVVASQRHLRIDRQPIYMCLAVDDRNEPALRLYRGLGFRVTTRKVAMIESLER